MKLSVLERILLSQILPETGSFMNLKLLRVAKEKLSFTDKENKELSFKQEEGRITWNAEKELPFEITLSDVVCNLIKDALIKLDKEEELTMQHMTLYEKFINIKENE